MSGYVPVVRRGEVGEKKWNEIGKIAVSARSMSVGVARQRFSTGQLSRK